MQSFDPEELVIQLFYHLESYAIHIDLKLQYCYWTN